jgi:hypothetical protein
MIELSTPPRAVAPLLALTLGLVLALVSVPAAAETAPAPATDQSAVWVQRKLNFVYMGFTSHYSCDGLYDKMKSVLLQLGARKQDLQIHEYGCTTNYGRPDPFPGVQGTFFVLDPNVQTGAAGAAASAPVEAQWQTVQLQLARDSINEAGQCELIEQIKQKVLPLFVTRNLEYHQNCIPYQLTPGATNIRVEVLKPLTQVAAAPAAAPPAAVPTSEDTSVYIYPRNGQSAQQQATDRDECHRWAQQQTGFDPSNPGSASTTGGTAASYHRAMLACLDARGYSAR